MDLKKCDKCGTVGRSYYDVRGVDSKIAVATSFFERLYKSEYKNCTASSDLCEKCADELIELIKPFGFK